MALAKTSICSSMKTKKKTEKHRVMFIHCIENLRYDFDRFSIKQIAILQFPLKILNHNDTEIFFYNVFV